MSSLLMPPTGSFLLVRSNDPPWLHLPGIQSENVYASSICSQNTKSGTQQNVDDSLKLPAGFAEEKMLK